MYKKNKNVIIADVEKEKNKSSLWGRAKEKER